MKGVFYLSSLVIGQYLLVVLPVLYLLVSESPPRGEYSFNKASCDLLVCLGDSHIQIVVFALPQSKELEKNRCHLQNLYLLELLCFLVQVLLLNLFLRLGFPGLEATVKCHFGCLVVQHLLDQSLVPTAQKAALARESERSHLLFHLLGLAPVLSKNRYDFGK